MSESVINVEKVEELVAKLLEKDEEMAVIKEDKKKLFDEYSQYTGVPDKKIIKLALAVAKKKGIDRSDLESLIAIIEPLMPSA